MKFPFVVLSVFTIRLIAMTFCTHTHVPLRMNCNNFGDLFHHPNSLSVTQCCCCTSWHEVSQWTCLESDSYKTDTEEKREVENRVDWREKSSKLVRAVERWKHKADLVSWSSQSLAGQGVGWTKGRGDLRREQRQWVYVRQNRQGGDECDDVKIADTGTYI